jgi:hypothetical protein
MLIAVCVRREAEFTLTGLSVTPLAAKIDAGLGSVSVREDDQPGQPPDEAPDGLQHG